MPAPDGASLRSAVRTFYAERLERGCCGHGTARVHLEAAPDVPSFGCGDPTAAAALRPGETVLDLGCGAGFDAFRAAEAVGPGGRVIGVDMTPAMLQRARAAAGRLGFDHVRFLEGTIEALPVRDASVDVVISNCVLNLSADVPAVLGEAWRVLRPGGRLRISDTFRTGAPPAAPDPDAWCACVAGAHDPVAFVAQARRAGFADVRLASGPPEKHPGDTYGAVLVGTKPFLSDEDDGADGAALLAAAGLPLEGWDAPETLRWGVREDGRLVAVVALERHGAHGLVRSLAVRPEARGRGLAHALVAHVSAEARRRRLQDVAALTTTIPDLLLSWGFAEVRREDLAPALAASAELRGACPASARAFVRRVTP